MKALMRLAMLAPLAALVAACGASRPIEGDDDGPRGGGARRDTVRGDAVDLWFESDGRRLPVFRQDGRSYLLGRMGQRYEAVIVNRTDARVEVVLSVDGRDAVSGREADYRRDRGYVLEPGEQTRVEGFRTSLSGVAAFEFATPDESYSARMGTPQNVGVIGLAVFDEEPGREPQPLARDEGEDRYERQPPPVYSADAVSGAGGSAKAAEAAPASPGLGTRYGGEIGSEAAYVPFVRRDAERPVELLAVYYDDREGLVALGIDVPEEEPAPAPCAGPNPFPGVPCDDGFAPPPPGPLHQE